MLKKQPTLAIIHCGNPAKFLPVIIGMNEIYA